MDLSMYGRKLHRTQPEINLQIQQIHFTQKKLLANAQKVHQILFQLHKLQKNAMKHFFIIKAFVLNKFNCIQKIFEGVNQFNP